MADDEIGRGLKALVTARPAASGVRLEAIGDGGQRVSLWLGAVEGMTLADDIHRACEPACWAERQAAAA